MTSTQFSGYWIPPPCLHCGQIHGTKSRNLPYYVCIWVTPSQCRRHFSIAPYVILKGWFETWSQSQWKVDKYGCYVLTSGTTSFAFSMRGHSFIFPLHHPISPAIYCRLAQPKNGPQFFIHPPVLSVCLESEFVLSEGLWTIHKWHWHCGRREWSIITQFYR